MKDFSAIKEKIVQLFYDHTHDQFLKTKLEKFFTRLLSDREGDLEANIALIKNNARLGAELAVAYSIKDHN
jgi:pseudouridine-5'-phosphate glycosidase